MKKLIILAISAIVALTVFAGCSYTGDFSSKLVTTADADLTKAKVGYGLTIDKSEASELVLNAKGYSQAAVPLPYTGFSKVKVLYSNTGKTTIGFLAAGSDPWAGRIDGKDEFINEANYSINLKVIDIPEGAGFITFGSNGDDSEITIKKITIE